MHPDDAYLPPPFLSDVGLPVSAFPLPPHVEQRSEFSEEKGNCHYLRKATPLQSLPGDRKAGRDHCQKENLPEHSGSLSLMMHPVSLLYLPRSSPCALRECWQ